MTKKHQRSAEELDIKKLFLFSFIPSTKKAIAFLNSGVLKTLNMSNHDNWVKNLK